MTSWSCKGINQLDDSRLWIIHMTTPQSIPRAASLDETYGPQPLRGGTCKPRLRVPDITFSAQQIDHLCSQCHLAHEDSTGVAVNLATPMEVS